MWLHPSDIFSFICSAIADVIVSCLTNDSEPSDKLINVLNEAGAASSICHVSLVNSGEGPLLLA